jgi:prolyl oligopeptidase
LYYHRLGTLQSEDILVYKDPENPEYSFSASATTDGQFVIMDIKKDTGPINKIYLIDLKKTNYQIIGE